MPDWLQWTILGLGILVIIGICVWAAYAPEENGREVYEDEDWPPEEED